MNIFLSWSGDTSKELAKVFNEWLPSVLQSIQPYFSPEIKKGERWFADVSTKLDTCTFGLLFLTKGNLKAEWIMFEAGALSKRLEQGRVSPILFGINATDLKGPLVQFQATPFNKDEIQKLIENLNECLGDHGLQPKVLSNTFEMWWPELEHKVTAIVNRKPSTPDRKIREDRELIEETLQLVRGIATASDSLSHRIKVLEKHTEVRRGTRVSPKFSYPISNLEELKEIWPHYLLEVRKNIGDVAVTYLINGVPTALTDTTATVTFPLEEEALRADKASEKFPYSNAFSNFTWRSRHLLFDWDPFIDE